MLRLLLALVFLFACWGGLLAGFESVYPGMEAPWWAYVLLVPGYIVPMLVATFAFNKYPLARLRRLTKEEFFAELDAKGQLEREPHEAGRVMAFDDINVSGHCMLVESLGKGTLMLHGQYLFSYGPGDPDDTDEGEEPEPRTFPTQRFELLRKRGDRDILEIARSGAVIEPEVVPAPVDALYRELMKWPMDGTLITDQSFDTLRDRLLRGE